MDDEMITVKCISLATGQKIPSYMSTIHVPKDKLSVYGGLEPTDHSSAM
jgi:hypothetical protein